MTFINDLLKAREPVHCIEIHGHEWLYLSCPRSLVSCLARFGADDLHGCAVRRKRERALPGGGYDRNGHWVALLIRRPFRRSTIGPASVVDPLVLVPAVLVPL